MLTVLRQRNFALMWWSGLISFTGSWMLGIARPLFVYQLTGSALATSLMFIAGTLPRILLGSVAGVFVDRWDRRRVMIFTNLLLAASILPLMLVQTPEQLWIVYLSALLTASLSQLLYPAENAYLPTLVSEEHLVPANALNSLNNDLSRLIGPALGGVVMAVSGFGAVVLIDAATFVAAALLIGAIRTPAPPAAVEREPAPTLSLGQMWRDWWAGLQLVRRHPTLSLLFTVFAITSIGEGAMSVLFTPFATDILRTGEVGVGVLMSAQAVGGLLGGVVIARIGQRAPLWDLAAWGCLLLGLIDVALFNYSLFFSGIAFAVMALVIAGVPAVSMSTSTLTLLQTSTDDAFRGRVFGTLMTTTALFSLIGMVIAGALGDTVGPLLINLQSAAYVLGGVLLLMRRRTATAPAAQAG